MKNHLPLTLLLAYLLLTSGCGKAAREATEQVAKKADEVSTSRTANDIDTPSSKVTKVDDQSAWLSTYLSYKIPATALRSLREREKPEYDFRLHPYEALLTGTVTTKSGEVPTKVRISFKQKCTWVMNMDITFFLEESGNLIRVDSKVQVEESLNSSKAYEQYYNEAAILPTYDADEGNIIGQSTDIYMVEKSVNGFEIVFKAPEEKTLTSTESAMLMFESEQHMLEMLRRGVHSYTQKLVDGDAEKLYTKDHITTVPYTKNSSGIRLWERNIESSEFIDGKWTVNSGSRGIVNSQGVPVYLSLKIENLEFEFSLQEVSFPPIYQCNYGLSSE